MKIKPVQTFMMGVYLYVIDDTGAIWKHHLEQNGAWTRAGELPEKPEVEPQVAII